MRGRSLALLFILASLAASLGPAAPAGAAVGDLGYRSCLADGDGGSCVALPGAPLNAASSVTVSPAGDSVYVAGAEEGVLATFARNGAGDLVYRGCIGSEPFPVGCLDLAGEPIEGAAEVTVSPDGASVYLGAAGANTVSHFFRDPSGALALGDCFATSSSRPPCGDLQGNPIESVGGAAVSPDGSSLYAVSNISDSISHFFKSPTGQLGFGGCLAETNADGCEPMAGPLDGAEEVVVGRDGRSVYATASDRDAVVHFTRTPTGRLDFAGCRARDPIQGCGEVPGELLSGASGLAISPDGAHLYVAGKFAITVFAIQPAGQLVFASCLLLGGSQHGCVEPPEAIAPVAAQGLAISSDGRSLYAFSRDDDAVIHFSRNPADGRLAFSSCLAGDPEPGSPCADLPGEPLSSPQDVAVSPDGASVYVVDRELDSIATFSRELGAAPPPPGGDRPPRPTARCAGKPATIVGTPRADTLRGTPRRDVIAALGGADQIRGRGGKDLICGGKGRDTILGGSGEDRCLGGAGRDEADCERGRGRRG